MRKIFPILLIGLLTSCSTNNNVIENKVFCFDTTVISKIYEGEQSNLDDIRDILLYYDRVSDNYKEREGITIKKIGSEPLTVESQLYDLLKTSVEVKDKGAKYFNPLCGSLSKKWKESLEKNEILSDESISVELDVINHSLSKAMH